MYKGFKNRGWDNVHKQYVPSLNSYYSDTRIKKPLAFPEYKESKVSFIPIITKPKAEYKPANIF